MKFIFGLFALASVPAFAADEGALLLRYLEYRKLPRITAEKIVADESVVMLCAPSNLPFDPHRVPFIHLYANETAVTAKKTPAASVHYPVGSLLVKEKFDSKHTAKPSIITIMEKIADTGSIDDWQFRMLSVKDRSMVLGQRTEASCKECHSRYKKSGFVSPETDTLLTEFISKK